MTEGLFTARDLFRLLDRLLREKKLAPGAEVLIHGDGTFEPVGPIGISSGGDKIYFSRRAAPKAEPKPPTPKPKAKLRAVPHKAEPCHMCGSSEAVYGPCPYQEDVHKDPTPFWMCEACRREAGRDV